MYVARILPKVLFLFAGLGTLCLSACKNSIDFNSTVSEADTFNFPLKTYAAQQLRTYFGMPYSLYRINHLDGRSDTNIVDFMNLDWSGILQTFIAADISSKKFADSYKAEVAFDELLGNRGYTYTAKAPDLYTRMMHINQDPTNNRITSIYIETRKSDFWGHKTGKLLYIPLRLIQIQEHSKSLLGKARSLRIDYKAMGGDDDNE